MKLKILKILQRFTKREKKILLIGSMIAVSISLMLIAPPLIDKKAEIEDLIEAKEILLKSYHKVIAERDKTVSELDALKERFSGVEGTLLDGETPMLASVGLQNIIEKTAKKRNVHIQRVKTLKSEVVGDYHKVFVEITFSSDIASLVGLLYDVENNYKALTVSEIRMSFKKNRTGAVLETILKVEGALKSVSGDIENRHKPAASNNVNREGLV